LSLALTARRWRATAAIGAAESFSDGSLSVIHFGMRLAKVVVLLAIMRALFAGSESVSGMSLRDVLTYVLMAEALASQLEVRTPIIQYFWDGTIATKFLQPMTLAGQLVSEMLGQWLPQLALFSLPHVLLAPVFGVSAAPASWAALPAFGLSLVLGIALGVALDFIFCAITVMLGESVWLISVVRTAIEGLLSGAIIPLALLPGSLPAILGWLPFASVASTPMRLYTGTGSAWPLVLLQLGWLLAMSLLALWLWDRARERVTGMGG
jgi:ABC-2 type transport system permease protein